MRNILFLLLVGLTVIQIQSCDPCKDVDCTDTERYEAHLRMIRASNGTDLVFGTTRVYEKEKLKFLSLKGGDTTFFSYEPFRLARDGYDSVLLVNFYPKSDTAFISLNNVDVDTLTFSYGEAKARCCMLKVISSLRFSNSADISNREGTVELKK